MRRTERTYLAIGVAAIVAVALAVALGGLAPASGADGRAGDPGAARGDGKGAPNVVVIMTDDQSVADMEVLPKTRRLIGKKGVTFDNNFASNPICCPSRSTFLSGQYAHNDGVFRNSPPFGGFANFNGSETLPVWLQRAGYHTGHIGKYLNGYGAENPTEIPPGWSEWYGSVDPGTYRMYGYTLNENGNLVTYGDYDTPDPATYQTDVYTAKAVDFIQRNAPSPSPFYLSVAPLAPHVEVFKRQSAGDDDPPTPTFPNPRPAPRDIGATKNVKLPKPPSFNEADVSDKPVGVSDRPLLSQAAGGQSRNKNRSRRGSLLAIDDMVSRVVGAVRQSGELNDTVIVFISDNGFLLGEHRIPTGKQYPYEESVRVPLLMRGPGIPKGVEREQLAANVDMAPTILDLTGATADGPIDGRSLMPLIRNENLFPGRGIVLENWCQTDERTCYDPNTPEVPRYRGVRTDRYAYMRYPNGEQEMYDLQKDPYELDSLQNSRRYSSERDALSRLYDQVALCATDACRVAPKLKLRLGYRAGRRAGKRCADSTVNVQIAGPDKREAVSAELFRPGEGASDGKRPLRLRVGGDDLSRRHDTKVGVQVSMLDGRIMTASGRAPRAC